MRIWHAKVQKKTLIIYVKDNFFPIFDTFLPFFDDY